ncbi:hypothetical protein V3C99_013437 [Haemonchus contortus]|uniref:ShKT domain-containing protein n=1 Tax=Haemonchus contortus TaxID=6289 RepID=A0A7I4Y2I1_HAECO
MLLILTLSALLIGGIEAGITDLNCTHMVGGTPKYSESAINCNNKISDAACLVIYTTAVEADNDTERDAKCAGNPVNPALVQAAIDICPKTCGYCCLTPAFMCDDKPRTCVDEAPNCGMENAFICQSKSLQDFAQKYCRKTCGFCNDDTTGAPGTGCGNDPK